MRIVTTTEAKARLNALLAEVADGHSVTITSHGRPVALLSPVPTARRRFGAFRDVVSVPSDFDAPMSEDDLALWGEVG